MQSFNLQIAGHFESWKCCVGHVVGVFGMQVATFEHTASACEGEVGDRAVLVHEAI